jgi:hypothetical protein
LDPTSVDNDKEMNREAKQKKLHWMGNVHYFLDRWQGS